MKKTSFILIIVLLLTACSNTHTVSITYEPNGGSLLNLTESINSNSFQWYPQTPQKLNSYFVNWYLDSELTEQYTSEALLSHESMILYAKYIAVDQEDFYLVSFISMGGTFTPNQLINSGDLLIEPSTPIKEGYIFLYWEYAVSMSNKVGQVNFLEPITEHLVLEAIYGVEGFFEKR